MNGSLNIKKEDINIKLLYLLIVSCLIPYYPKLSWLKSLQYILFFILVLININRIIYNTINYYKYCIFSLLTLFIYYAIVITINKNTFTVDIYSIIISFIMFIIFSSLCLSNSNKEKVIAHACISVILISAFILYDIKGNLIVDFNKNGYFYGSKNGLGPIIEFSGIYLLYLYLLKDSKKIIHLSCYILSFYLLALIQTRTAILSFIIASVFIVSHKYYKINNNVKILKSIICIFSITVAGYFIFDEIIFIVMNLFNINSNSTISSISTGRSDIISNSINLFYENPILGIKYNSDIISTNGTIHNLWVKSLFYGGILYFIIFLNYVASILYKALKYTKENRKIVMVFLIVAFINSNLEVISPFGPGTSFLIFWLVISANFKNYKLYKEEK